ncbi:MAG: hypothetical protein QXX08_01715 [Candidatus Bathyarchaeia archaeon]
MFGVYDFFPKSYHGVAHFSYNSSIRELQRIIIETLYQLNQGKVDVKDLIKSNIEVILEFGIADGATFNYIDQEMLKYYLGKFYEQIFPLFDFFCVVRYHIIEKDKRKPLRFDYYILRFLFREEEVELQIFHEKGTRRLSVEDLITFLMKNINRELAQKNLGPLNTIYIRAL